MFGPLIVLQFIVQIALTFGSMDLSAVAAEKDPMVGQAKMMADMYKAMVKSAYVMIAIYGFGGLLMTTAAARRLHDRNRSGWWALALPAGLFTLSFEQARRTEYMIAGMEPWFRDIEKERAGPAAMFEMQTKLAADMPMAHWTVIVCALAMLWLVVELILPGNDGANRFGPEPE